MQAVHVLSPQVHFLSKSAANSSHISHIGQALEPQKCWTYGQNAPQDHATCTFYGVWPEQCTPNLSHACRTVQILPALVFSATNTAHSVYFERFVGVYSAFSAPCSAPRGSIMSIMGPVWAPNFLLDTTHMRLQDPSKTLSMLRCPKVRNEGPIVLMIKSLIPQPFPLPPRCTLGPKPQTLRTHTQPYL